MKLMEAKVSKAEQRLNAYAKRVGMSQEGKHWLMAAIDPFHDKPLSINGYPDGVAGKSIVQCIKLQADISKPAALPAGATWDCLLTTSNFLSPHVQTFVTSPNNANTLILPTVAPNFSRNVGGLVITKALTGSGLAFNSTTVPTLESTNLAVPNTVFEGKSRVLSQGFEVCNTSNALYKNGSVTCFELPCDIPQDKVTYNIMNGVGQGSGSFVESPLGPGTIASATQIPGAKTWEAKDGCYVVCRQANLLNPPKTPQHVGSYTPNVDQAHLYPSNTPTAFAGQFTSPPETPSGAVNQSFPIPFHMKGAYFTNLSEQTTLKVCYNVWVERFPNVDQYDLMSLATESCDYDVEALEAWSNISAQMPCGVTFEENGLGDWFTGEVASLIDSLTGTRFATGIDKWQKEKFNGVTQDAAQMVHPGTVDKRKKMNTKAKAKGLPPKQGPLTAQGKFKQNSDRKK